MAQTAESYIVETCPACGAPIDYCNGHGLMGDPLGYEVLVMHADGDHSKCNPEARCAS